MTPKERAQEAVAEFERANEELFEFMDANEELFAELADMMQEYNDTLAHAQKAVQSALDADPDAARVSFGIIGFRREARKDYKGDLLYDLLSAAPDVRNLVVTPHVTYKVDAKALTRLERQGEISPYVVAQVTIPAPRIVAMPGGPKELAFKPVRAGR